MLRLKGTGKTFVASRSEDSGKTWGPLHNADNLDKDMVDLDMPDDVLVGIATCAVFDPTLTDRPTTEAVGRPFPLPPTPNQTPPPTNGLAAPPAATPTSHPPPRPLPPPPPTTC